MKCRAAFTIEATLIMPVVILGIVFLLYTGMYQYDRCVIEQDSYICTLYGSTMKYRDNRQILEQTKAMRNRVFVDKYLFQDITGFQLAIKGNQVEIVGCCKLKIPLFTAFENQIYRISRRRNGAEIIRLIEQVKEID